MKKPTNPWLYMIGIFVLAFMVSGTATAESQTKKIQTQAADHYSLNESPSHKQINPVHLNSNFLNPKPLNSKHLNPKRLTTKHLNPKPLNSKQLFLKPPNPKHLSPPANWDSPNSIKQYKKVNSIYPPGPGKGAMIGGAIGFVVGGGILAYVAVYETNETENEAAYMISFWIGVIATGALMGFLLDWLVF